MRFLRARPDEGDAGLPLTSLIDVVFLLLIYFLITARMTSGESQLQATLASQNKGTGVRSPLQPQVLSMRLDSKTGTVQYTLGDRSVSTQTTLTNLLSTLPKEGGLFVKVPDGVSVEAVAIAMQAASDAGFSRINYVPVSGISAGSGGKRGQ
jgi:biopolymer transport protein ExbD